MGLWRRLTGFYFPPWLPVVLIIVVVFGIVGGVIFARQAGAGAPNIGKDHWHARYEVYICGVRQPVIPAFPGGVHTHGDGIVHIHPQLPSEEGRGARLVKFFEYAGGRLSADTLQMPGDEDFKNGDLCQGGQFDGQPGVVQVYVNGQRVTEVDDYLPRDGDNIRIVFAPEGQLPAGTTPTPTATEAAIPTITIEAGDRGRPEADSFFNPNAFTINAGQEVKVVVTNTGSQSHNLRIAGIDNRYDTEDDFVSDPIIITPGNTGSLTVRIDEPGTYDFRCDIHPQVQFGTLTVSGEGSPTPTATP